MVLPHLGCLKHCSRSIQSTRSIRPAIIADFRHDLLDDPSDRRCAAIRAIQYAIFQRECADPAASANVRERDIIHMGLHHSPRRVRLLTLAAESRMRTLFIMAAFLSSLTRLSGAAEAAPRYKTVPVFDDLRSQALAISADLAGAKKEDEVYAVLMETGYPEAVATLVSASDGSTSLYYSNGGGTIGAGGHAGPKAASKKLVAMAAPFLKHMTKTEKSPLPKEGFTQFYVVTRSGLFAAEAKEEDLGESRLALSPLFHAAHELIHEITLIEKEPKKG